MNEQWQAFAKTCNQACENVFGEKILYQLDLQVLELQALVSHVHVEVDSLSRSAVSSHQFSVDINLSQLTRRPKLNDKLEVRSQKHKVIDIIYDHGGGVKLILMKI